MFPFYSNLFDSNLVLKIYFNSTIKYFCFIRIFRKSGIFGIFIKESREKKVYRFQGSILISF